MTLDIYYSVYFFAKADKTKYHRLEDVNNQNVFFSQVYGLKVREVSADFVSSEASLAYRWSPSCCVYTAFSPCTCFPGISLCDQISFS